MDSEASFEASLEEDWDSKIEKYLWDTFGCRVTPTQKKKLYRRVGGVNLETGGAIWHDSPAVLFEQDQDFQGYVASRIKWAFDTSKGWTNRRILTKAVDAICRYNTPRFGWPDYKEAAKHGYRARNGNEETKRRTPEEKGHAEEDGYAAQLAGVTYIGSGGNPKPGESS